MTAKPSLMPTLVGESNPYGSPPCYALYPEPDGCAGHRLCTKILGMTRNDYLDSFFRVNLCNNGKWSMKTARHNSLALGQWPGGVILLGSKVCKAFDFPFHPFHIDLSNRGKMLCLPHPSGLCRLWHEPGYINRARAAVITFAPHLADKIGALKP